MASSLEKLSLISCFNSDYLLEEGDITGSWPVMDSLEKFKPKYVYYSRIDLDYRKTLRRERLLTLRIDPFSNLTLEEIKKKYKFFPHTITDILELVADDLERVMRRSNPLTPKQIVCIALYVLGHGMCSTFSPSKILRLQIYVQI